MTLDVPLTTPFATLAATTCPSYDEMLVAIESEFRAVDRRRLADAFDDRALALFALRHGPARERVRAVAAAAWDAIPDTGTTAAGWLPGVALETGEGSSPIRACLAVELARRAGMRARPVRMRGRWFVAMHDRGAPVAADAGPDPVEDVTAPAGCLCAHAVALTVLSGVSDAWARSGDRRRARRAAGLRLLLPLDAESRLKLVDETRALEDPS